MVSLHKSFALPCLTDVIWLCQHLRKYIYIFYMLMLGYARAMVVKKTSEVLLGEMANYNSAAS